MNRCVSIFIVITLQLLISNVSGYEAHKPEKQFDVISISRLLKSSSLEYEIENRDELLIVPSPSGKTAVSEDFSFKAEEIFAKTNSFRAKDAPRLFTWKNEDRCIKISVCRLPDTNPKRANAVQRRVGSNDANFTLLAGSDIFALNRNQMHHLISSFYNWMLDEGASNDIFPKIGTKKRDRFTCSFDNEIGQFWHCLLQSDASLLIVVTKESLISAIGTPVYSKPIAENPPPSNAMHLSWITEGMQLQVNWGDIIVHWTRKDENTKLVYSREGHAGTTTYPMTLAENPFSSVGNYLNAAIQTQPQGGYAGTPPFAIPSKLWVDDNNVVEISNPTDLKRFGTLMEKSIKSGKRGAFILAAPQERLYVDPDSPTVPPPKKETHKPATFWILSFFADEESAMEAFRSGWSPSKKDNGQIGNPENRTTRAQCMAVFLAPTSVEAMHLVSPPNITNEAAPRLISNKLSALLEADKVHGQDMLRIFTRQRQRTPHQMIPSVSIFFYDLPSDKNFGNLLIAPFDDVTEEPLN